MLKLLSSMTALHRRNGRSKAPGLSAQARATEQRITYIPRQNKAAEAKDFGYHIYHS